MICFPIFYVALGVAEDEKVCVTIHSASCIAVMHTTLFRFRAGPWGYCLNPKEI